MGAQPQLEGIRDGFPESGRILEKPTDAVPRAVQGLELVMAPQI